MWVSHCVPLLGLFWVWYFEFAEASGHAWFHEVMYKAKASAVSFSAFEVYDEFALLLVVGLVGSLEDRV